MLTAKDKPDSPLQCSGHASLIQTDEGNWYIAYLCTRPVEGKAAILGRETAIQEVYWTEDSWLRLVGGGKDRKSTRLNSSHVAISYADLCLQKNKKEERQV